MKSKFIIRCSAMAVLLTGSLLSVASESADEIQIQISYDKDGGYEGGIMSKGSVGLNNLTIPTEGLDAGIHTIFVRAKDAQDRWTVTYTYPLFIVEEEGFCGAEYYIDNDPGDGNGVKVEFNAGAETAFIIPTDSIEVGDHILGIKCVDDYGRWTTIHESPFKIIDSAGVNSIEWIMSFRIERNADSITLYSENLSADCRVEVYSMDGRLLSKGKWTDTSVPYSISIGQFAGGCIIRMYDPSGYRAVRRVI